MKQFVWLPIQLWIRRFFISSKRFQPGEGPCRGFLHDYEPSCGLGTFVWSSTWDTAPSYVTHQLGPWRQNTRIVGIQFGAMQGGSLIKSAFHSAYNRGLAEAVQSLQSWVGGNGVWCIIVIACTVFMVQNKIVHELVFSCSTKCQCDSLR